MYAIERHPKMAQVAREIIALNGFADKITVIEKLSMDITVIRGLKRMEEREREIKDIKSS